MKTEGLEKEFERTELFTPQEMAQESRLLDLSFQQGGGYLLRERYLNSKKIVNLDDRGYVKAVVHDKMNEYTKYNIIYSVWVQTNLSKLRTNYEKKKTHQST